MMLRRPDDQAVTAPARIVAFDRARTFITMLVLLHHSVLNYTYFGSGDRMRWLGFCCFCGLYPLFRTYETLETLTYYSSLLLLGSLYLHGALTSYGSLFWYGTLIVLGSLTSSGA
jgi:hypothetical protein